jgi:alpha-2-macroglobulin
MIFRRKKIILLLFLSLVCVAPGCRKGMPGAEKAVAPKGVESLIAEVPAWAEKKNQPLKVQFAGPRGETDDVRQIIVAFNKPVAALEALDSRPSAAEFVKIEPEIPGEFHWLGVSAISFQPAGQVKKSTGYKVTVGKDIKAIDGKQLKKDYVWNFETPRAEVVSADPAEGSHWTTPAQPILIEFNQPVDPSDLRNHLKLYGAGGEIPVSLAHPVENGKNKRWPKPERVVIVTKQREFLLDTKYLLTIEKDFHGAEGALPMKNDFTLHYSTYGPFKVEKDYRDSKCDRSVHIEFNNPVNYQQFIKNVAFDPKAVLPDYGEDYDFFSNDFYHPAVLKPLTYHVAISGALKDKFGQQLGGDYKFDYESADYEPELELKAGIGIVEEKGPHKFPLSATNVDTARLRMLNVDKERIVSIARTDTDRKHSDDFKRNDAVYDFDKEVEITKIRNANVPIPIDLDQALKDRKTGILFVYLFKENMPFCGNQENLRTSTLVQVTDIGLMVKTSWDNTIVWATRLSTGRPVPGALLTIKDHFNSTVWKGVTDKNGIGAAPGMGTLFPEKNRKKYHGSEVYVIAEKDGDTVFLSTDWTDGLELWSFDMPSGYYRGEKNAAGYIFTERDVYRPGEKVHFKGIVRMDDYGDFSTPEGKKVKIAITDRENKKVFTKTISLNKYGTFAAIAKMPLAARLGYYSIEAKLEGATNLISGSYRLEEYRAPEFEVSVATDKNEYTFGGTIRASAAGKYFFGAPMKGGKIEWTVSQSASFFTPPKHDDYIFGDNVWQPNDENYEDTSNAVLYSNKTKLGGSGVLKFNVPLKQGAKPSTKEYTIEATVTDENRQTISEQKNLLVHQGEFYIGLKPNETFMKTGGTLRVGSIAAAPDGSLRRGRKIKMQLFRREWHTVLKQELGNNWYYESKPVDKQDGGCDMTTSEAGSAGGGCEFKILKSGYYYVQAKSADRRGNSIVSSFEVYAIGGEYVSWRRENDNRIELAPDKKLYVPGDTATILIKSPYRRAKALVTTEREKIFSWKVVDLNGTTPTIKVKVPEKYTPNFGVSVIMISGRTSDKLSKEGKDVGKPSFSVGYANLKISTLRHRLRVQVKADKEDYRPGGRVNLSIKTKDARGKGISAEVAVMVVDEGVLSLTGYRTPNPHPAFYSDRGISVDSSTSYIHIIDRQNYGKKGNNPGGSGKGGAEGYGLLARNVFETCAFWKPSVVTDARGDAKVSFKLPDNLTKYRIMVVANTRGADFGRGQNWLRVNKPLMVRPSLPRFITVGDTFSAGAVMHNYAGGGVRNANLSVDAKGIALVGQSIKTVSLSPGKAREVRFSFRADKVGKADFTFIAAMGGESDSVRVSVPVVAPLPSEAVAAYGVTADKSRQKIVAPKNVRKDVGGLTVTMSSTALSGLEQGVGQLVEYPYGCLEQTVSRALPLLLLEDIAKNYNIKKIKGGELRKTVQSSLDELALFQKPNGGMSYWENTSCDDPYLSAYAFLLLSEAGRGKYKIDGMAKKNLEKYLDGIIRGKTRSSCWNYKGDYTNFTVKPFIIYALANAGAGDSLTSFETTLYENRKRLSLWSKAYLAMAIKKSGGDSGMISDLMHDIENHAVMTGAEAHFEETYEVSTLDRAMYTSGWLTAVILTAMTEADPENPLIPKTVRWLLRIRTGGRWQCTHEASFALMALSKYYKKFESAAPSFRARANLYGKSVLSALFEGRSTLVKKADVPIERIIKSGGGWLDFTKTGRGLLFYTALLSYSPTAHDLYPRDEGFIVVTDYTRVGEKMKRTEFRAGDTVKVSITVIAPLERNYVVVEDPIPAGFEIVNQSFKTSKKSLMGELKSGGEGYCEDECEEEGVQKNNADLWNWWVFNNVDMKDDRIALFADHMPAGIYRYTYIVQATTPGVFFDPSTQVSEMYTPDVFGRSGSKTVTIK